MQYRYNGNSNECGCSYGAGVVPGGCIHRECGARRRAPYFKTEIIPASAGTDAKGEPLAPKFGAYTNTIVEYQANGAIYFYDSKGIYTKIVENGKFVTLAEEIVKEAQNRKAAAGNVTSIGDITYSANTVNLGSTQLTAAKGAQEGMVGQAGVMSSFQATQLAALASAYEAEEKGTTLYEGTASVNNITLSESGMIYDHLIVVAEYMGMGSAAIKQQVSAVFYPTDAVKSFQMTATDITVGSAPAQTTVQDIWAISDDGMELDLVSSAKAELVKNGSLTFDATPETTSMFTITKVVGFGKKQITG